MKKQFMTIVGTVLLVTLLVAGYIAIAAEINGKEDPLVPLSYINDVLTKGTSEQFDSMINDRIDAAIEARFGAGTSLPGGSSDFDDSAELSDAFIDRVVAAIEGRTSSSGTTPPSDTTATPPSSSGSSNATFKLVDLPAGKKLIMEVGGEAVLRIGSATCVAPSTTGLIDLTTGQVIENDSALTANHLYLATIADRGLAATNAVKVLVKGSYTIS